MTASASVTASRKGSEVVRVPFPPSVRDDVDFYMISEPGWDWGIVGSFGSDLCLGEWYGFLTTDSGILSGTSGPSSSTLEEVAALPVDNELSELFFFDDKLAKNPLTLPPPDPDPEPVMDPESDLFPSLLLLINGLRPPKESDRFFGPKSALAGAGGGGSAGGSVMGGVFIPGTC